MPPSHSHPSTSYPDALALLHSLAASHPSSLLHQPERVPLSAAPGRVAFHPISAPFPLPRFTNSAMDGYVLSSRCTLQAPVDLRVAGSIMAGDPPLQNPSREEDCCYQIMTGAPFPLSESYDAVVPLERVASSSQHPWRIALASPIPAGAHRRLAGEDIAPGDTLLSAGDTIRAEHVLALASLGIAEVEVRRRVSVAVVPTGNELVSAEEGRELEPGEIWNSNGPYRTSAVSSAVSSALASWGHAPRPHPPTPDSAPTYASLLSSLLASPSPPDTILSTGAVSHGAADFLPLSLPLLHATPLLHGAAIRPGHPVLIARLPCGRALFALPGNPTAAAACLRFLVEPYLRALQARPAERPLLRARLKGEARKPRGVTLLAPGRWGVCAGEGAEIEVELLAVGPAKIKGLAEANCWVMIPEGEERLDAGALVDVWSLSPAS